MALTKTARIFSMCFAVLAIAACAKKNNDIRARNSAGAQQVGANTQAAQDNAKAMGYDFEFVSFAAPTASGGSLSVQTQIRINNNYYNITTLHNSYGNPSQPAVINQNLGGASIQVSAMCGDQYCNPYYIMVNVSSAQGTQVIQSANMKYFYYTGVQSQNDVYVSHGPGQFLAFPQIVSELNAGSQAVSAATP